MDGLSRRALLGASLGLAVTPGAAWAQAADVGVVGAGGVIVSAGGARGIVLAGRTRATGGRALSASDAWHIGSNTKAMTAALYARMVEAGRCRWGASVAALFLDRFVGEGVDWAHFDTFAWRPTAKPGRPRGGEALALRAAWHMIQARFG